MSKIFWNVQSTTFWKNITAMLILTSKYGYPTQNTPKSFCSKRFVQFLYPFFQIFDFKFFVSKPMFEVSKSFLLTPSIDWCWFHLPPIFTFPENSISFFDRNSKIRIFNSERNRECDTWIIFEIRWKEQIYWEKERKSPLKKYVRKFASELLSWR